VTHSLDWRAERDAALLALEREKSPRLRIDAAEVLCDLAIEAPVSSRSEFGPAVVRLVSDKEPGVRCAGLALASEVLDEGEAVELLGRFVADGSPRVRVEALGRLADFAHADTRGIFAAALEDDHFPVRFEAARGMVALKHSAGLDVLLEALDDPEFRFRAAAALAQLGNPAALPRLQRAFRGWLLPAFDRTQLAGALAVLGDPQGFAHLEKRATKGWSMDRAMAVELLGAVKAKGAFERLAGILRDPKDVCRGAAARGLGLLGDTQAAEVLLQALDQPNLSSDLQLDIAEGLLLLKTPEARARVERLTMTDEDDKLALAELLAQSP
jgi:HEAT repeat protein